MAQSSVLSLPFIFWTKVREDFQHEVQTVAIWEGGLASGGRSGELVFWKRQGRHCFPRIVATPGSSLECTSLVVICPPFHTTLQSSVWVVSLHQDARLRVWDPCDGRCVSVTAKGMFASDSRLTLLAALHNRLLAVAGEENNVHIVDAWSMTRLSSYCIEGQLAALGANTSGKEAVLVAVCTNGNIALWTFRDVVRFLIDPDNSHLTVDCLPAATARLVTLSPVGQLAVAGDLQTVLFASCDTLYFIRRSWIQSESAVFPVSICVASVPTAVSAVSSHFWVCFSSQTCAIVHQLALRLPEAAPSALTFPSETAIKVVSFPMKPNAVFIGPDCVYTATTNAIYGITMESLLAEEDSMATSSVSLHPATRESAVEERIKSLMGSGETLTDSHIAVGFAWPVFIVGTSAGRVLAASLASDSAVACYDSGLIAAISSVITVAGEEIVAATVSGAVQTWRMSATSKRTSAVHYETRPRRNFQVCNCAILRLCELNSVPKDTEAAETWAEFDSNWQRKVLIQASDFSIMLADLEQEAVMWRFFGICGEIREAFTHNFQDYLLVLSTEGLCYVINLANTQLERIAPVADIPYRSLGRTKLPRIPTDDHPPSSLSHQMLSFTLSSFSSQSGRSQLWVEYPLIGNIALPALCVHVANIREAYCGLLAFPDQAEFLISLINQWRNGENLLPESVSAMLQLQQPALMGSPGTFGAEDAISFVLPTMDSPWSVSGYFTSVLSMSLLAVLEACSQFKPTLKATIADVVEDHIAELCRKVTHFSLPSLIVLSCEVLTGDKVAYALFRSTSRALSHPQRKLLLESWKTIFHSAQVDDSGEEVGEVEVLAVLNLTALSDSGPDAVEKEVGKIVETTKKMLVSAKVGHQSAAIMIITDEMKTWHEKLSQELIGKLVTLLLHLQQNQQLKHLARTALLTIGKHCVSVFFQSLKEEVERMDRSKDYPNSVLTILEVFLHKYAVRSAPHLQEIVAILMVALNPKLGSLRKVCLEKATDVLELIVKKLPMVAFEQRRQRLAVGTVSHEICIYDLKQATVWKKFRAHGGPVNAICFNSSGTMLASYCSSDQTVKSWKFDSGFLGLGHGSIKPLRELELEAVFPLRKSARDLFASLRVKWSKESLLEVTREDGCTYQYAV